MMRLRLAADRALRPTLAAARRRGDLLRPRLNGLFLVRLIVRTAQEAAADDATHMAAGVAYYGLFSLFPLLLGLTVLLSFFVEPQSVQTRLADSIGDYLPGTERLVTRNIEALVRLRGALSVFAIVGLFWSSSAVFGAVTRVVNRAWDVHKDRPIYISKPRQLAMALGVGVLFVLSMGVNTFVQIAERMARRGLPGFDILDAAVGRAALYGTSLLLAIGIFLVVYKFTPNTRTYWRYVWPGAVFAGVSFEAAKNLFIVYVDVYAGFDNIYGSLAPVIALLLWTYVSSLILIIGAELSSEYGRLREGVARCTPLHGPAGRARRTGRGGPEQGGR